MRLIINENYDIELESVFNINGGYETVIVELTGTGRNDTLELIVFGVFKKMLMLLSIELSTLGQGKLE